jgi:hypothetical protein
MQRHLPFCRTTRYVERNSTTSERPRCVASVSRRTDFNVVVMPPLFRGRALGFDFTHGLDASR